MSQYIYGKNTVLSALIEGKAKRVFVSPSWADQRLNEALKKQGIVPEKKSTDELDRMAHGVHQGIVAEIADYRYATLEAIVAQTSAKPFPLLLMLDQLSDPHNLGAILRSADAFGVDGIIIKKTGQVTLNATVAKVSTGAIDHVPVCQVTNLSQALDELKKKGFWIVASSGNATQDYRELDYRMPTVLVIGAEGDGISRLVLDHSDFVVKIPMVGRINSLNASVAAGILLATIFDHRSPLEKNDRGPTQRR